MEQERDYSRQQALVDQQLIRNSKVLVLGCGATGSWVAFNLASLGVGSIHVVDHDIVENSNVNRQGLYANYIGCPKATALATILDELNPNGNFKASPHKIPPEEIDYINYDVIINCTDDLFIHGQVHKHYKKHYQRERIGVYLSPRMNAWTLELFVLHPDNPRAYFQDFQISEEERKLASCSAEIAQTDTAIITTTQVLAALTTQATIQVLHKRPFVDSIRIDLEADFIPKDVKKAQEEAET